MKEALKLHWEGIKTAIAGRMAYRGDFFISMFIMFLVEFIVPAVTFLIYANGSTFPGWTLYEVLLIQTVFVLSKGIASPLLCGISWNTIRRVQNGTFDLLLIKPRPVLHMALVMSFDSEDLGKLFGGLVMFALVMGRLPPAAAAGWAVFFLLLAVAVLVHFAFALFLAGLSFKWVGCWRMYEVFDSLTSFGFYPRTIFSKTFQALITGLVPIALVGFLPASALLGRPAGGAGIAAAVGLLFFGASLLFWQRMLRSYSSAGG